MAIERTQCEFLAFRTQEITVKKMDIFDSKRKSIQSTIQYSLAEIRKELSLSQTDLARLLGKSRQGISLIERVELEIGWETCLAIIAVIMNRDPELLSRKFGDIFCEDLHYVLNS